MFDNIGSKIKGLANVSTVIGIVVSLVIGGVLIESIGIFVIILGCVFSWISSLTLYGFGHLIEKVDILAQRESLKDKNTNEEKLINEESEDPKAEMRRQVMSEKCNAFKRTGIHSRGMCLVCYAKDKPLELCKIKDDMVTREWPICDECIKTFENEINQ
jgi:hypothetical protein